MASKDQELGELILHTLEQRGGLDSYEFSKELGREHQTLVGAIKSLQSVGNVSVVSDWWALFRTLQERLHIYTYGRLGIRNIIAYFRAPQRLSIRQWSADLMWHILHIFTSYTLLWLYVPAIVCLFVFPHVM